MDLLVRSEDDDMANGKWRIANGKYNAQPGFTVIELIIVMVVFSSLLLIATINLVTVKQKASLSTSIDILLADMKQQQLKAMTGDAEGRGVRDEYGIHFEDDSYVLFYGSTYYATSSGNFTINLGDNISFTNSPADIVFSQITGEIQTTSATIVVLDNTTNSQKTITVNKYGVVTGVN